MVKDNQKSGRFSFFVRSNVCFEMQNKYVNIRIKDGEVDML